MKIYTKTGDKGLTSLIGGTRVAKHHMRIESYGTVDELNSYIGLIGDQDITAHDKAILKQIQDRLFTIGSSLAADPEKSRMVIPDLHMADIARCVCRRAERITVHLAEESKVDEKVNIYLNRLSDYLFTLARKVGHENKIPENKWMPRGE
jgi:cob(I)alamin adenosyltransferase